MFRWIGSRRRCRRRAGAAEDRGHSHGGFDPRGLAAAWNNITGGTTRAPRRSPSGTRRTPTCRRSSRSAASSRELVLSVKLETQSSKDEISPIISTRSITVAGLASGRLAAYFGKTLEARRRRVPQYLAAIIRAPSFYASKKGQADLRAGGTTSSTAW